MAQEERIAINGAIETNLNEMDRITMLKDPQKIALKAFLRRGGDLHYSPASYEVKLWCVGGPLWFF